jgi:hypothetical protein
MNALSVGFPRREKSSVTPRREAQRSRSQDTSSVPIHSYSFRISELMTNPFEHLDDIDTRKVDRGSIDSHAQSTRDFA